MMCLSDIDIVSLVRPGNSAADDTASNYSRAYALLRSTGYLWNNVAYSQVKYYYDIMRVAEYP